MSRPRLLITTLLVYLSLGGGCGPKVETVPETFTLNAGNWPFWPVKMRFHPLTRFVITEGEEICSLEARVEFNDLEGDISKALGQMNIKLYEKRSDGDFDVFIENWDIDLEDRSENRTHYSVMTRTYLFRLEIEIIKLRENMELVATFNSADEQVFDASFTLEFTPPPNTQD